MFVPRLCRSLKSVPHWQLLPAVCVCPTPGRTTVTFEKSYSSKFLVSQTDPASGTCVLSMNKPPVNSLCLELMNAKISALDMAEKDPNTTGVILTSDLPDVFSAGLDLNQVYGAKKEDLTLFWYTIQEMWFRFYTTGLPMTVAINGHAPAGGTIVPVTADYRAMRRGPSFQMGLPETRLGIIPSFWFQHNFGAVMNSRRRAEYAVLAGKLFNSQECLEEGLVDCLVDTKEEAVEKCREVLAELNQATLVSRAEAKRQSRQPAIDRFLLGRQRDLEASVNHLLTREVQKGLEKYLERLSKKKHDRKKE